MAPDRPALRKPPVVERRPAVAAAVHRSAQGALSPAQALQQRLGNQGTQALVSRSVAGVSVASPVSVQFARVSQPNDPAELEAKETARKVVQMGEPAARPIATTDEKLRKRVVQRAATAPAAATPAAVNISAIGGSPLPSGVRSFMEPRFGANFGNVRVHAGEAAAQQSASLSAHAFTVGEHVFFGRGQFQPESAGGRELIAHELTHTIQQGAAVQRDVVQRSSEVAVREQVSPHVQRGFSLTDLVPIPDPRKHFANKARAIPGFTMLTVVIGFNPISNERVDRNAGNILRGAIELIPGGSVITEALNNHGVFDKVSGWAATQFDALKDIGSNIVQGIENFLKQFQAKDLLDPGGLWERAKAIVVGPIDRIKAFAINLKNGVVNLIKDAILKPIATFARGTKGYPLLTTVMGKDPITDEPVHQDADALVGGFLTFIGEDEIWANMQKAKAVPRVFTWFKGAVNTLKAFFSEIPGLFVQAFKALEVVDIVLIPRAFAKLVGVFGNFVGRFVSWGANAVWTLLEIIIESVKPGALAYIKKTGAALKSILKNPTPFVGNLVKAAKLGFQNFAGNFLTHLKTGLIDWLTGSLPGIYIPKAFSLVEIAKFAFSVLGLSWANIRQKLVKAVGDTAVKSMETGFDIVVALVRDGPAAAWDKIKEQLTNLKDMVIGGVTDFVVDMVVKQAVPKIVAMFIPGAGFISAIVSIYETVMVFVEKIKKIVEVVTAFIDSIVAIAGGAIGAAATRVETTLAGILSLAINFLAGFAGLGKVADKVMKVIEKVRAPIDKAIDWLIGWIVTTAKKLFAKAFGKDKKDERTDAQKQVDLDKAMAEAESLKGKPQVTEADIRKGLLAIKLKYKMTSLELVIDDKRDDKETIHFKGDINPKKETPKSQIVLPPTGEEGKIVSIASYTDRPKFRPKTKEAIPIVRGQEDRRHIVAWQAMHEWLKLSTNGKKVKEAAGLLIKLSYTPKVMTMDGIKEAGKVYLLDKFNDDPNLWAGPAKENQEKGQQFSVAKRRVDKALEAGDRDSFNANIVILEDLWHDPDPTGAKIGFKNMVGMTIKLLRNQFKKQWG